MILLKEREDALRLAINMACGLAATVRRGDGRRLPRVSRGIKAETAWIDDAYTPPPGGVWGGYERSGIVRELGPYGIHDLVTISKSVSGESREDATLVPTRREGMCP
jgi:acyl-CoA reductase-like NAD-dependent aldehyde dehydrogenase